MPVIRARLLSLLPIVVILALLLTVPAAGQDAFGGPPPAKVGGPVPPVMTSDQGLGTTPGKPGKKTDKTPGNADKHGGLELNAAGFVKHLLGTLFAKDPKQLKTDFIKNWAKETTANIQKGLHPAHLLSDLLTFFHALDCNANRNGDGKYTQADTKPAVPLMFLILLDRRGSDAERTFCEGSILNSQAFEPIICGLFNRADCPWKAKFGEAVPRRPDYQIPVNDGKLNPATYQYDAKLYKPIFDIAEMFCDANQEYSTSKGDFGHRWHDDWTSITDCSGFVGQFFQKLAAAAGMAPPFPKDSWYPVSGKYMSLGPKVTAAFPPTDPRDLIHPGDVFVMGDYAGPTGHVGIFMGYDPSGNPIIAHSTPSIIGSRPTVKGNFGRSGMRIEVLPPSYRGKWNGIWRVNGTDDYLRRLSRS